ncbi:MAG TPA: TfoX/Sxy family protein [Rhodanobacteraceae bacterium]|nr:TfoX/Sxy family protein [Rhodanobacteraceae bacterium]
MASSKIRNVGPKSAAWLRQIGVRTTEDLNRIGPVEAFLKVKRAGFRPSLNLLYAMAGAMADCHWAELPEERKQELLAALTAAESANPIRSRWEKQKAASERAAQNGAENDEASAQSHGESSLFDSPDAEPGEGGSGESDPGSVSRFD